MMKKGFLNSAILAGSIFTLIIVLVFSFSYYFNKRKLYKVPEEALIESFESSGAVYVSSEIYFTAALDKKYEKDDYLNKLLNDIAQSLNLDLEGNSSSEDNSVSMDVYESDLVRKLVISGEKSSGESISISVELLKMTDSPKLPEMSGLPKSLEQPGRKITVGVTGSFPYSGLPLISKSVEAAFKMNKVKPVTNSCIIGNYQGKIDYINMNEVCKNIFSILGAKKVGNVAQNNLVSVSAYSPAIGNSIKVDRNKSNIDIAVRYNGYEQKTYIWIATPAISMTY
ncbi:MAG TPA: YwmB family TATA-box binding protein [Clostridiales bacterium]|nr:YwmB family TATA-box binding protein [Clostridiales bacterium]